MSLDEWLDFSRDTVDPEVRAYVGSLVNAVGGISVEENGKYVLGDDIIGCLKDLRRWIRFYDEKLDRLDVQRVLAESNFLKGDILEILGDWPDTDAANGFRSRIALLCLELFVPLTWSLEIEDQKMTVHHHKHLPYLKLAQVEYKRAILQHDSRKILRQIIRVALPSMSEPKSDRSVRDDGIIRLVLYGLRNVVMISQPSNLPTNGDEAEISRASTIDAFHSQDVLQLILTVASSMGEEFDMQDVVILELLFHLLKGIDPTKLFMEDNEITQTKTVELRTLLNKEKAMLAGYKKHAPTRHNRFGTMVWLKKDNERISTISGQAVISGPNRGLQYLDKAKKWNKPKFGARNVEELGSSEFDKNVPLSSSARKHLGRFVEEFLDSSFNPLFTHLRRSIERELDRVLDMHHMQYFYLISWFLKAECARRTQSKAAAAPNGKQTEGTEAQSDSESFSIIAGVMNQETFVLLNRYIQSCFDNKAWHNLNAGMKCFTQILLTVQQMEASTDEDDQEIAENIQNRIFYEGLTHDRILTLLRSYKDQGIGYLDAVTELSHVFIRMLESYSKQNADMQIRSRRRARKRQAKEASSHEASANDEEPYAGDIEEVQQVSKERKFDFHRFSARFATQGCVDTFVAFVRLYKDMSPEQLKRAHRFFYRVAFKLELYTMLFRVDIIQLFYNMIKGVNALNKESSSYEDWEEFVRQLFKRLTKRLNDHPELMIEMLFSKMPSTLFYLEHGYDKQVMKSQPRPPAELEVRPEINIADRIALVTEILVTGAKFDAISLVREEVKRAAVEREAWEAADEARRTAKDDSNPDVDQTENNSHEQPKPPAILLKVDNEGLKTDLFKDNKLKLLLKLIGYERLDLEDVPGATWLLPSAISSAELKAALEKIQKGERGDTLESYPNVKAPEQYLRRKPNAVITENDEHVILESDSEGEESFDENLLFPAGGPTNYESNRPAKPKKNVLRRKRKELANDEKSARADARRKKEIEKRRRIKSDVFINPSDDETDEEKDREFYAKEEERKREVGRNIMKALEAANKEEARKRKGEANDTVTSSKKRRAIVSDDSDSDRNVDNSQERDVIEISSNSPSPEATDSELNIGLESETDSVEDTPVSSQPPVRTAMELDVDANKENRTGHKRSEDVVMSDVGDNDEDDSPVKRPVRRNIRAGFIIDDSDSE